MIFDFFSELNWLAIIVATVAWFVFSAIWYSVPPLSKAWADASGVDPNAEGGPSLAVLFIPTYIGYFVTAVVIALIAEAIGASTISDGVALGVTLGIGFGVVNALVNQLYERKGNTYFLINGVNAIIAYSIVAVIVAVWD